MKKLFLTVLAVVAFISCKNESKTIEESVDKEIKVVEDEITDNIKEVKQSVASLKADLKEKGFQIFDYVDEATKDTIIMQQYFIAFLKSGPVRDQNEEEANKLQEQHLAHLGKMYELGYADISGPFGDDGDIRGITIYNVPTLKMADSLANADPMVKAGRLKIEIHPWWAAKGFSLR